MREKQHKRRDSNCIHTHTEAVVAKRKEIGKPMKISVEIILAEKANTHTHTQRIKWQKKQRNTEQKHFLVLYIYMHYIYNIHICCKSIMAKEVIGQWPVFF